MKKHKLFIEEYRGCFFVVYYEGKTKRFVYSNILDKEIAKKYVSEFGGYYTK